MGDSQPSSVSPMSLELGQRLKTIRKRKLLTITQVSLYTGLSVGYLSNVERGQTSPTVANLTKICRQLDVAVADVLAETPNQREVIGAADAAVHEKPEVGLSWRTYDFGIGPDSFDVLTFAPGEGRVDDEAMHPYPETCYVISGRLEVIVEGTSHVLEPGDALCVRANHRHVLANPGDEPSVSLWYRMAHSSVTGLL